MAKESATVIINGKIITILVTAVVLVGGLTTWLLQDKLGDITRSNIMQWERMTVEKDHMETHEKQPGHPVVIERVTRMQSDVGEIKDSVERIETTQMEILRRLPGG